MARWPATVLVSLVTWLWGLGAYAEGPARGERVVDAAELAERAASGHAGLAAAKARVRQAERGEKVAGALFGPTVRAGAELTAFNRAWAFDPVSDEPLNLPDLSPELRAAITQGIQRLVNPVPFRDQTVWGVNATVVQPVTGVYSVYQGREIARQLKAIAESAATGLDAQVRLAATLAWLAHQEALAMQDIAEHAAEGLEAHAARLTDLVQVGALPERLLAEVEAARALADTERAAAGAGVRATRLAARRLGRLGAGERLDERPLICDAPPPSLTLAEAVAYAAAHHAGERVGTARVEIARRRRKLARWSFVPDVTVVGRYDHLANVYVLPPDQLFVGLAVGWELTSWGGRLARVREAREAQRAAEREAEQADDAASAAAEQAYTQLTLALEVAQPAERALEAARRAYQHARQDLTHNPGDALALVRARTRLVRAQQRRVQLRVASWRQTMLLRAALLGTHVPAFTREELSAARACPQAVEVGGRHPKRKPGKRQAQENER